MMAAIGSLVARFRAVGMARTMAATAVAQLLAAGVGLAVGLDVSGDVGAGPSVWLEALLTACFAVPWLASAVMFQCAARTKVSGSFVP